MTGVAIADDKQGIPEIHHFLTSQNVDLFQILKLPDHPHDWQLLVTSGRGEQEASIFVEDIKTPIAK